MFLSLVLNFFPRSLASLGSISGSLPNWDSPLGSSISPVVASDPPYYVIPGMDPFPCDLSQPLILLVEDQEDNIFTTGVYLMSVGYRVIVARDGFEALMYATTYQPDLILMDVQIPKLDGLQVTQQLRAMTTFAQLPILAITAFAFPSDHDRCLAAGATAYFSKPVRLNALEKAIAHYLKPTDQ